MDTLEELEEATAFEMTALAAAASLAPTTSSGERVLDLRGEHPQGKLTLAVTDEAGSGRADELRRGLRPLLFGAAWKTLDLLVEYALETASRSPKDGNRWKICEKASLVTAGLKPVAPFEAPSMTAVWAAAIRVYSGTVELRHALVHGTAEIKPNGDFEADRKKGHFVLTADQQLAVCRAAQRTVRAVLDGSINGRDLRDLNWQLDQLTAHTGQPSLGGTPADVVCEVLVNLPLESGQVTVDVPALLSQARTASGGSHSFDLVGYLDDDPHMPLVGELDTAPPETTTFAPATPPAWLRSEYRP